MLLKLLLKALVDKTQGLQAYCNLVDKQLNLGVCDQTMKQRSCSLN